MTGFSVYRRQVNEPREPERPAAHEGRGLQSPSVSVAVSLYNTMASRRRELALLRALGAPRSRLLWLVVLEAAVLGVPDAPRGESITAVVWRGSGVS